MTAILLTLWYKVLITMCKYYTNKRDLEFKSPSVPMNSLSCKKYIEQHSPVLKSITKREDREH